MERTLVDLDCTKSSGKLTVNRHLPFTHRTTTIVHQNEAVYVHLMGLDQHQNNHESVGQPARTGGKIFNK